MDNPAKKTPTPVDKWRMVGLSMELGFIIALPLLIFSLLGKYLDNRWHTAPWLTLAGILIAIASTTIWLIQRIKEMMK
ncbi:MAG: AtpZ/AtpI family protein [Candidatus Saccharibacteria bacterium]